jgi:hypothetical protein
MANEQRELYVVRLKATRRNYEDWEWGEQPHEKDYPIPGRVYTLHHIVEVKDGKGPPSAKDAIESLDFYSDMRLLSVEVLAVESGHIRELKRVR